MNNAYLAGFFDGEGCISIRKHQQRSKGVPIYSPRLSIGQKHSEILKIIQEYTGMGSITDRRNVAVSYWRLSSRKDLDAFIQRVEPYVIVKKPQVEVMREFLNLEPWGKGLREKKEELYHRIKKLKRI